MDTKVGATIASYRITGALGEGGMGVVYRAEHVLLRRPAAIKVLQGELLGSREMVVRFLDEARAATAIRHPGIVEIYEFGIDDQGCAFIVMELLDGESLSRRLARGALSGAATIQIGRQIAGALAAAHDQRIVHRDLKPDNVFLVPDPDVPGGERIKLLDFGIAKVARDGAGPGPMHVTRTGALMGTPAYMAPEQCRGVAVDHRADLYALGCVLFQCVCGRPPFAGEGVGDVLLAHVFQAPPRPREVASVGAALEAVILHLLEKAPDARPASAADVIRALDAAALDPAPAPALAPSSATARTLTGASTAVPVTRADAPRWRRPAIAVVAIASSTAIGVSMLRLPSRRAAAPDAAVVAAEVAPRADAVEVAPIATSPPDATSPPVPIDAAPATIVATIDSSPSGALVVADGVPLGRTPLRTELRVRAAPIALALRLAGYQEAQLRVRGDRPIDATVILVARRTAPRRTRPADADRGVNPFGDGAP